jgi:hypothetical protein
MKTWTEMDWFRMASNDDDEPTDNRSIAEQSDALGRFFTRTLNDTVSTAHVKRNARLITFL